MRTWEEVEYRDIAGFEGYRVGNDGSVWTRQGRGFRAGTLEKVWRLRRPTVDTGGFLAVKLSPGGVRRFVHQLVLEAFVGPAPAGMMCRHFPDLSLLNNRLDNLQWATLAQIRADKDKSTYGTLGSKHWEAKLTEEQVLAIRKEYTGKWGEQTAIAKRLGVSPAIVHTVISGRNWKHLTLQDQPPTLPTSTQIEHSGAPGQA